MTSELDLFDKPEEKIQPLRAVTDFTDSLDRSESIVIDGCKLCLSENREEAEEMFGRTGNYTQVLNFLRAKGESTSMSSVRRHLQKHYFKPELNASLVDYAEDVKKWAQFQQTTEERYVSHLTLLERQIHLINANTDPNSPEQLRKSTDAVVKLMEQAGKIEERLKKHKERFEPIEIFIGRFRSVLMAQLGKLPDEDPAREILENIMDAIEKEAENVING